MRWATQLVQFEAAPGDPLAPAVTPLYQTATFRQPTATGGGAYDYSRSGNPTREVLERQLARLEGGCQAFAFASGMAAIDATLSLVPAGGAIVACSDLYGGTFRYLQQIAPSRGVGVTFADTTDPRRLDAVLGALTSDGPVMVLIETPSNPEMRITDLRAAAEIAHAHGAWLAVDNSLMSPYLQRPLALGADLVIHSATKFLNGHGQLTAGAVIARSPELAERVAWFQNAAGSALGPFDCWLLLSGLKTLALRMDRQQETARHIARVLDGREEVTTVYYPGLDSHPGADLHRRQADGPGSVLTVRMATPALGRQLVQASRLFANAVSFGSVSSTIELPGRMSHAPMADGDVAAGDALVRLSIGIEDVYDLEADLLAALCQAEIVV